MAIFEEKCYGAKCDVCGELFEDSVTGFSIYVDEGTVIDEAQDEGWYITEDNECYCPKCYEIDEDDNVVIKSDLKGENHESN